MRNNIHKIPEICGDIFSFIYYQAMLITTMKKVCVIELEW